MAASLVYTGFYTIADLYYNDIEEGLKNGDSSSYYQMGMFYLLGINKPIDFKKASYFFREVKVDTEDTKDAEDAEDRAFKRLMLLGFIAECECDYSSAFKYYAETENCEKDSYIERVIKGRNHLQDYFKDFLVDRINKPLTLNNEISSIFNDFSIEEKRTEAIIKIAAICEDEQSCLEVARIAFNLNDYFSAIKWLKKGNIPKSDPMYMAINDYFEKSWTDLLMSKSIQVVELANNSLLPHELPEPNLNKVKKLCEEASLQSLIEWKTRMESYKNEIYEENMVRIREEEIKEQARMERKKKRIKKIIVAVIIVIISLVIDIAFLNFAFELPGVVAMLIWLGPGLLMLYLAKRLFPWDWNEF